MLHFVCELRLSLAEGRSGECYRPVASDAAMQDRLGGVTGGVVYAADSGLQQYATQVPGVPDPGRGLLGQGVALEM